MFMEKAKVVIVEDRSSIREPMRALLAFAGHSVSHEVESLEDALSAIDAIAGGDMPCDVMVLDGNLRPNQRDNSDASQIIDAIRQRDLAIKIVGFSGTSMARSGIDVDFDVLKPNFSTLVATINEL